MLRGIDLVWEETFPQFCPLWLVHRPDALEDFTRSHSFDSRETLLQHRKAHEMVWVSVRGEEVLDLLPRDRLLDPVGEFFGLRHRDGGVDDDGGFSCVDEC